MTAKRRSRPPLSRTDAALWHQVAQTVRPLRGVPQGPDMAADSANWEPPQEGQPSPAPPIPRRRVLTREPMAPAAALDRGTARRLRRGQIVVEAHLDLHGLTRDQAHGALDRFLKGCHQSGRRCVLVITGKGGRRQDQGDDAPFMRRTGPGVLRSLVPLWLEAGVNRHRVLAYHSARPGDGGDGAFYVLLRRRRLSPA